MLFRSPGPYDSAKSATILMPASVANPIASTDMPVSTAAKVDMSKENVIGLMSKGRQRIQAKEIYPKYAHNYLWEEDRHPTLLTSADLSEYTPPLPDRPP